MKHHIFSSFQRHFSLSLPIYRTHYLCSHFNIILILNGHLVWMQITIIWISNFLPLKKSNNKAAVYLQVVFVYMPYRSGVGLHVVLMLWSCSKTKERSYFLLVFVCHYQSKKRNRKSAQRRPFRSLPVDFLCDRWNKEGKTKPIEYNNIKFKYMCKEIRLWNLVRDCKIFLKSACLIGQQHCALHLYSCQQPKWKS